MHERRFLLVPLHRFPFPEESMKVPRPTPVPHLDPLKIDPGHYKLEFENPQVRVLRVRIQPHGMAPMHAYSTDRATIFLTDQNFRIKDSTGKVETVEHKAGDVVWETPIEQTEQNLSNQPFEAVTVEVKR